MVQRHLCASAHAACQSGLLCIGRQIETMAASAAAQQAADAEAVQQLTERLREVDAALSEARESELSLRVCPLWSLCVPQESGIARPICGMRACEVA